MSSNTSKTILLLAANPKGTTPLRLDEEVREINEGLLRARQREQFELVQKWAVRPQDVQRAMLDEKPQIVHFSGHGAGEEGLVFENEVGQPKLVAWVALAGLFKLFAEQVGCVVLNGCYSQVQAEAVARHIPYVVGMKRAIGDTAAIAFAVGFYDALGAGETIEFAYELGCNAIHMEGLAEHLTPVLLKREKGAIAGDPSDSAITTQPTFTNVNAKQTNELLLVFISYSHKDSDLREELEMHLSNLRRQGKIKAWHDRAIEAGAEWDAEIKANLESAHVILLLISPRFMASEYCYDQEMQRAISRHNAGTARVIPIILKPVDWKDTPFSKLQVFPQDGKPINTWDNQDEAFLNVVWGIRTAVEELKKQSTSQANSQVSPPSVEVEQELNESDREILTDLLIRSGRAEYSARRALCIKIGIEPNQLGFLRQSTDADFALELINYLHSIDDKQAICKICKELEIVFKRGKNSADLKNIKSKINCD